MASRITVQQNVYHDSVTLMWISREASDLPGVTEAVVVMGTDLNKGFLERVGLLNDEARAAQPSDLVIAIAGESEEAIEAADKSIRDLLQQGHRRSQMESRYATLRTALEATPDADLVCISVPGQYAAAEVESSLNAGKHVFLFSDNVPVEDEVRLKRMAVDKGLLLMGPDCGTAIVSGVGLGFSNVIRQGAIGVVSASGSGAQEVISIIHGLGGGVSHAIGTGGRDLRKEVGGIMMTMGIRALEQDPATKVIVVISKPPDAEVSEKVLETLKQTGKPAVVCFLASQEHSVLKQGIWLSDTLENAAKLAIALAKGQDPSKEISSALSAEQEKAAVREAGKIAGSQRFVHALYSGGTLCDEAMHILGLAIGDVYSNTPLVAGLEVGERKDVHFALDLGDDTYTQGRAHPMIDPTLRQEMILQEAEDPGTALLLLDCVIGYGSHPDPAGALATSIEKARDIARSNGRYLPVAVCLCGTDQDPQGRQEQISKLEEAGALVFASNAQAAAFAARFLQEVGGAS